jgi:hypothetical protein
VLLCDEPTVALFGGGIMPKRIEMPPGDPLLLFSVLYPYWLGNYHALNVEVACKLAEQFRTLAEKHGATFPRMVGHGLMGSSLLLGGSRLLWRTRRACCPGMRSAC